MRQDTGYPLRRPLDGRFLAGVAAGAADYFDLDVVLVRVAAVALALLGIGIPLYLAAWLLVPAEGDDESIAEHLLGDRRPRYPTAMGPAPGPPPAATWTARDRSAAGERPDQAGADHRVDPDNRDEQERDDVTAA